MVNKDDIVSASVAYLTVVWNAIVQIHDSARSNNLFNLSMCFYYFVSNKMYRLQSDKNKINLLHIKRKFAISIGPYGNARTFHGESSLFVERIVNAEVVCTKRFTYSLSRKFYRAKVSDNLRYRVDSARELVVIHDD